MQRYKTHFEVIVRSDLFSKGYHTNVMQLTKIDDIVINIGIGNKAVADRKQLAPTALAVELITGQKPIITRAKKSVDKFKLRENMPIGCKATLRKAKMYDYIDKLVNITLPNIEDLLLKDVSTSVDRVSQRNRKTLSEKSKTSIKMAHKVEKKQKLGPLCNNMTSALSSKRNGRRNKKKLNYIRETVSLGFNDLLKFRQIQYDQFESSCPNGIDMTVVTKAPLSRKLAGCMGDAINTLSAFQIPLRSKR